MIVNTIRRNSLKAIQNITKRDDYIYLYGRHAIEAAIKWKRRIV